MNFKAGNNAALNGLVSANHVLYKDIRMIKNEHTVD